MKRPNESVVVESTGRFSDVRRRTHAPWTTCPCSDDVTAPGTETNARAVGRSPGDHCEQLALTTTAKIITKRTANISDECRCRRELPP